MSALRLHHVQVGCPPGGEDAARRFYHDGLGLVEVDKPAPLRGRGGAWFLSREEGGTVLAEVHVGVEDPCVPPPRAHLALLVGDVARLDTLVAHLRTPVFAALGVEVDTREAHTFPGYRRAHVRDPHGNRVELLASPDLGIWGPPAVTLGECRSLFSRASITHDGRGARAPVPSCASWGATTHFV